MVAFFLSQRHLTQKFRFIQLGMRTPSDRMGVIQDAVCREESKGGGCWEHWVLSRVLLPDTTTGRNKDGEFKLNIFLKNSDVSADIP